MPRFDWSGRRFGNLTVVKFDHTNEKKMCFWECQCDCGNTIIACGSFLKSGLIQSCGCHNGSVKKEPEPISIKVGQQVYFDPFNEITGFSSEMNRGKQIVGSVVMVNYPHQWFSVEYGKPKMRTSFKFSQLGAEVNILR